MGCKRNNHYNKFLQWGMLVASVFLLQWSHDVYLEMQRKLENTSPNELYDLRERYVSKICFLETYSALCLGGFIVASILSVVRKARRRGNTDDC